MHIPILTNANCNAVELLLQAQLKRNCRERDYFVIICDRRKPQVHVCIIITVVLYSVHVLNRPPTERDHHLIHHLFAQNNT